ncbi:serine hydrolase [Wenzhouxiangella marina]|uniref:Beta-lactamase class A catalytic domain-containing protein n=1 Tax=Wenzhouxiangella marina TaxID=1579979 RepID=A0A0K0XXP6_9GAMM|nr:serine hydrolase [Wenzhouxiangella marina]AKS42450.1 hypothetical protein WM2015_2085 [Wenzhouxiangella marina]MBB6085775.1 hypothetical protein [Wenzhouxiangella marina]
MHTFVFRAPVQLAQLSWNVLLATLIALSALSATSSRAADLDDRIFGNRFSESIAPLFPIENETFVLPALPVSERVEWIVGELAAGENTSLAEIQARFSPGFDPASLVDFFNNNLRPAYPNARIVDVIGLSPTRATFVIDGDNPASSFGFVNVWSGYSGSQLVTFFQVSPFSGSVQYPADQTLSLEQAADAYMGLAANNALLVARIDSNGQCRGVLERSATSPRALGSIFKMWVLAALAERLDDGLSAPEDSIALVAAERAAGGIINDEPLGTPFSVRDMAILMLANSDNTSTDHLHELVGRSAIADVLMAYGLSDPAALLPFLNISEQFHVFTRFDLATAQSYVNGSPAFRDQFLSNQILPEGPSFPISFPFFHESLLTTGTWRASAMDICRTFAGMNALPRHGPGFEVVNQALGYQAAQPGIRNVWDRVWYKGGSLTSGASGNHVLTHAWMLQKDGASEPWVVVALSNDPAGGIDPFPIQSLTSRIIELIGEL